MSMSLTRRYRPPALLIDFFPKIMRHGLMRTALAGVRHKKAPRSRGRNEGHALAARQAPYHFHSALLVQTDTDERGAIIDGPVAPILPHRHSLLLLGSGAEPAGPARWVATYLCTSCRL